MKSPFLTLTVVLLLLVLLQTVTSRPRKESRKDSRTRNPEKNRKRKITILKRFRHKTTPSSTESTPYPTTTITTTPETTTPLCVGDNGEQLQLGQEVTYDNGCRVCQCNPDGKQCYVIDCVIPMCVDYAKYSNRCCGECPNGPNCLIQETGEIISEPVELDGRYCWCPNPYEYWDNWSDRGPIAICKPFMTTPPPPPPTTPPCVGENGEVLEPGQHVMHSDGGSCRYCECDQWEGLRCLSGDCLPPMCFDYVLPNGSCCYECPNGQNCRIDQTGEIITDQVERDGFKCWCPEQIFSIGYPSPKSYTAICIPSNTSTTPDTTTTPSEPEEPFSHPSEPWTSSDATDGTSLEPRTSSDTPTSGV